MKKIIIIIIAVCMMPLFSCSVVIESQLESLGEKLDELGDELDENSEYIVEIGSKPQIEINKDDKLKTRKFDIVNYNALSVGYSFQVVMCDTVDSVTVRVNEKLDKYLVVKVKNGTLVITLDKIGGIKSDNTKCGYVYLPYNLKLSSFDLSGTSSFSTMLPINVTNCSIDLSGASSFKSNVNCIKYSADLSGTARCRTDVKCQQAYIDLSGASKHESNIECSSLTTDLSGTAKLKGNIKTNRINAEISGASQLVLAGRCDKATVDMSGTGKLDCKKLRIRNLSGDMNGASKAIVTCSEQISMELSGTSHLVYYGNPKANIDASMATTVERK